VQAALLVRDVPPQYPRMAKDARIAGTVRLKAVIGRDGTIEDLQVIDGHPFLVQAAMDAVKQWAYKPTLLNGKPVEVATEIVVHFSLTT
jgi:protein TonB